MGTRIYYREGKRILLLELLMLLLMSNNPVANAHPHPP